MEDDDDDSEGDEDDVPLTRFASGHTHTEDPHTVCDLSVARMLPIGTYVAVIWRGNWYVGIVEEECPHKNEVFVNFLEAKGQNKFSWPKFADKLSVPVVDVIAVLTKLSKSKRYWKLSQSEYLDVLDSFEHRH